LQIARETPAAVIMIPVRGKGGEQTDKTAAGDTEKVQQVVQHPLNFLGHDPRHPSVSLVERSAQPVICKGGLHAYPDRLCVAGYSIWGTASRYGSAQLVRAPREIGLFICVTHDGIPEWNSGGQQLYWNFAETF
jgi:hypothetical protein